jgi:hypothetical protein
MKARILFGLSIVLLAFAASVFAQGPVVLYNPLSKLSETNHTDADEQLAREKLVPKARTRWSDDESCDGSNLNIVGAVDGSFTRTGAKQRALIYEMCQTGNGFANNGLAVMENGRVVAHFTAEGGWSLEAARIPDLNKNGRDEIVIETGGGMHQGYTGSSITVLELSETTVTELGTFLAYTNECESYAPNKFCDRSYKVTAARGVKPLFFAQKYLNRGTDERPRWVVSGKPVAAKRIGDPETKYEFVK